MKRKGPEASGGKEAREGSAGCAIGSAEVHAMSASRRLRRHPPPLRPLRSPAACCTVTFCRRSRSGRVRWRIRSLAEGITTDVQAKAAGAGIHKIADATGLTLKVGENGRAAMCGAIGSAADGARSALARARMSTLAEALKLAAEQRVLRGRNIDPIDERRRVREEIAAKARAAKPVTFREMTEQFLDEHAPDWKRPNARTAWLSPVARTPIR